jgi:hypothetical protein
MIDNTVEFLIMAREGGGGYTMCTSLLGRGCCLFEPTVIVYAESASFTGDENQLHTSIHRHLLLQKKVDIKISEYKLDPYNILCWVNLDESALKINEIDSQ